MEFIKTALPWIAVALCVAVLCVNVAASKKRRASKEDGDKQTEENYMTEGMCVGMCVGMAIGSEWMSLGMVIGLALGMLVKKK